MRSTRRGLSPMPRFMTKPLTTNDRASAPRKLQVRGRAGVSRTSLKLQQLAPQQAWPASARMTFHQLAFTVEERLFTRRVSCELRSSRLQPDKASATASQPTTRPLSRFHCPYKRAHEFAVHLRRDRVHINSCGRQKLPRILHAINSRRLNRDLLESRRRQPVAILTFIQRASRRHAADQ